MNLWSSHGERVCLAYGLSGIIALIGGCLMAAPPLSGQPPELNLSVEKTEVTIGELLLLKLEIIHSAGETPTTPFSTQSLGEWEVRNLNGPVAREVEEGRISQVWECQLTVYKTGEVIIPSIEVELVTGTGKRRVLATEPIPVKIRSVLTKDNEELKEVRRQAEIAPDYKPFLILVAAVAAAVLLLAKLVSLLRTRRQLQPKEPLAAALSPEQVAREAIELLLARKLVEQGQTKQFFLELSEIVKRYLGSSLDVLALERTTQEFLRDLARTSVSAPQYQGVRDFLSDCDLVKFAKSIPAPEDIHRIVEQSFEIIDSVKTSNAEAEDVKEGAA